MKPRKPIINLHNSSKGQENTHDLVDRISALPDSILGHILSNLSTKNAVATTILSKRWKFVWMTAHNLDFCLEDWKNETPGDADMKLIRCVNHVLPLYNNGLLNKFRLIWKTDFISFQISSWVTFAITRNVHELYLCVGTSWDPLPLPITLFSCESLQCLELNGSFYVSAAVVISLPRLESLTLVSVDFQSEETLQKLISGGCPMLNYLHIDLDIQMFTRDIEEDDVFTYRISSPSLRRLEICDNFYLFKLIRRLELADSSLEYLKLDGPIHEVFVHRSLSSLVEADLDIFLLEHNEDSHNSLVKGVRSLDYAKTLTLSAVVMWALSNATIPLSTTFTRLTKLNAQVACCYCSSLQDVIQSSNSLEVLTIVKQPCDLTRFYHDHSNWTAPVEVPQCLSNSLKEVSFEGYNGCDDEREMIGYLLQHGTALEVMQVTCLNKSKRKNKGKNMELVKEICRFPRKSPACKVEFID